ITGFDVVIERINPGVGLDESFAETVELREYMLVLHLLNGFTLLDAFGDDCASLFEHIDELAQIRGSGQRAMTGNNLHVGRYHAEHFFIPGNHSADAAAAFHIYKWKTVRHKIVSHVNYISLFKKNHTVSIRVGMRKM